MGGREQRAEVTGPLGAPVLARWACLEDPEGFTAVIEMAEAAGLALVGAATPTTPCAPRRPVSVSSYCSPSAKLRTRCWSDAALGHHRRRVGCRRGHWRPRQAGGTQIIVACDVRAPFLDAARSSHPRRGLPEQVTDLSRRLESLAGDYRDRFGVDVTSLIGAGAAGGLAGGLAALGAKLTSGFELVARRKGLRAALEGADLVVTGEGRLDATSFDGKVVGGVVALAGPTPVLCITGEVAPAPSSLGRPAPMSRS